MHVHVCMCLYMRRCLCTHVHALRACTQMCAYVWGHGMQRGQHPSPHPLQNLDPTKLPPPPPPQQQDPNKRQRSVRFTN